MSTASGVRSIRSGEIREYADSPGPFPFELEAVGMIRWDEKHLEELVQKMGLERAPEQENVPVHQSLFVPGFPLPLLTQIMQLDAKKWRALGYDETDRVSVTRYLGSLGYRMNGVLAIAARCQQPLTLELAKVLIEAGACDKGALGTAVIHQQSLSMELANLFVGAGVFDKESLSTAAVYQQPLPFELAKLLVDAGCDPAEKDNSYWDALVYLATGDSPVDPQVTDLFLSAGCRTDLNGCSHISDETHLRFDQILKEHAEWKEKQDRMSAENSPADTFYGTDWGR